MITIQASCQLSYTFHAPTPAIFMLKPRTGRAQQIIQERYEILPFVPVTDYIDQYGNLCQRVVLPEGRCQINTSVTAYTSAHIDVSPSASSTPVEQLPHDVLIYLLASRYCLPDKLLEAAQQITQGCLPGYDQAAAICNYIHHHLTYAYGTSDADTTAVDTWQAKTGVCRDFTHLGISLCRALSMPARMVVGYLYGLKPMDMHAWYEVFIDGRWYTFDATQSAPKGGRIIIAYGRDAADVAFATFFNNFELNSMQVKVDKVIDWSK